MPKYDLGSISRGHTRKGKIVGGNINKPKVNIPPDVKSDAISKVVNGGLGVGAAQKSQNNALGTTSWRDFDDLSKTMIGSINNRNNLEINNNDEPDFNKVDANTNERRLTNAIFEKQGSLPDALRLTVANKNGLTGEEMDAMFDKNYGRPMRDGELFVMDEGPLSLSDLDSLPQLEYLDPSVEKLPEKLDFDKMQLGNMRKRK